MLGRYSICLDKCSYFYIISVPMNENTIRKITLICAIIASLFLNIDFRLFFLFRMDDVGKILQERSWKQDLEFLKNNQDFSYKVNYELPAIIIFHNLHITTPQSTIWIDLKASEELRDLSDDGYKLILKEVDGIGFYRYYLGISGLIEGENSMELQFEDKYGYICTKSIKIDYNSAQILGVSSDRDEIVIPDGDSFDTLVDEKYGLSYDYIPSDLVPLSGYDISSLNGDQQLRQEAAQHLEDLMKDALHEGVYLYILSAYRSYNHQLDLYNFKYRRDGAEYVKKSAALPGHSEHQLGTAVDFTSDEIINGRIKDFSYTSASRWLALHAYKYGFVLSFPADYSETTGIMYEPWHYRYVGVKTAKEIRKSDKIPIEYLRDIQNEKDSN